MWKRKQTLIDMEGVPPMAGGAPMPTIVANEEVLTLFYYLQVHDPTWDGTTIRMVDVSSSGEPAAAIRFTAPLWHRLGPPNEEAIAAHPLCKIGLYPYTAKEVIGSETVSGFCRANRVHPYHKDKLFAGDRHFAIAFHDSVFEAVAKDYSVEHLGHTSLIAAAIKEIGKWDK